MADLSFLLQAATKENHADAVRELLSIPDTTQVLVSVAFVVESGVVDVEAAIKPLAARAKFFIGIRNDITSVQAVKRLLKMKVQLYAVDTGSRHPIFHPKLYFASSAKRAHVIIGSANLTFYGLHNNIEASTIVTLDISNPADKAFADAALGSFDELVKNHPQHVFLIKDDKHADELFEAGRLADETVTPAPTTVSGIRKGQRDDLPRMKLFKAVPPPTQRPVGTKVAATKKVVVKKAVAGPLKAPAVPQPVAALTKYLVWESKELTERDLNIPKGTNTHSTGSMGLKKGAFDGIDQRHYFRDEVFSHLQWTSDPSRPHIERAQATFEIIIKNVNYGLFYLKLSHNTDTASRSYEQDNMMTHLSWGEARQYVAKDDLLGRILYLYRKDTTPPEFTIEID